MYSSDAGDRIPERPGSSSQPEFMNGQFLTDARASGSKSVIDREAALAGSRLVAGVKSAFSFPVMLATFVVAGVFLRVRTFSVDPDLWWHIRVGQNILSTHSWPTTDSFSYTVSGTPWLAYEWLGDVMIGSVAKFGLLALEGLLLALGGAIMIAVYYLASLRAGNSKAGFVTALVLSWFSVANFNLRPQMFGFLFLVFTLILLEKFRRGSVVALWFLPLLFVIWINTHGSWVIGLAVVGWTLISGFVEFRLGTIEAVRWSQKQRLQLELALLGCVVAIPITPYGTELAAYPFTVASSLPVNVAAVSEWLPMPFETAGGKLFLCTLLAAFALQSFFRFTFRLQEWALALGGTAMAILHVRFVLLFVPFFAPVLALMLARWIPVYHRQKDKFALNAILMAAALTAMVWYFPSKADLQHEVERRFPVRAVEYFRAHGLAGPVFNSYVYGGYLVGYLPEQKVFIDGRGDLYEVAGAFTEYLQVVSLKPAAFSILKSYGIQSCMLERTEPLAIVLGNSPDWKRVYADDASVIFVRNGSSLGGS